ncbi:MAG: carbamoyltransferase HypF, partial [Halodesulfurarchaeum sp.]|nr:carbamoyltransferase HypF [Halodesulfurarchaeum sp.]
MTAARSQVSVRVTGVVQGVGFRPFVYRRATAHDLGGTVRNTGDAGVKIILNGDRSAIDAFLQDLRNSPPPLSRVETVTVDRAPNASETRLQAPDEFRILESVDSAGGSGTIPPDTGICESCLEDVFDPKSRYYGYWATSCVDCGPRYTVIRELPYDRPRTSMDAFPMCEACRDEYEDPADRRYHAQTIACQDCGPTLSLEESTAEGRHTAATGPAAIAAAVTRLQRGEIVAIRGVGGTHLACDGTDSAVVKRLRERTNRPAKPFAVMSPSVDQVRSFAAVSDAEADSLQDVRRPIVVLERDDNGALDDVAPGLHTIGVMLPYAGLHHLLFDTERRSGNTGLEGPLVMTSGNLPGEPMCVTVDAIFEQLGDVIDAALVHDREIVARCDDSVVRHVDGARRFLRRSRGWVPQPLPRRQSGPSVLAVGAEFDGTIAIARDEDVIPSQHLGDIDGPATETFLHETTAHLTDLLGVDPEIVACDAHPNFLTSHYASEYVGRTNTKPAANGISQPIRVQHHHAHAASLLGEYDRERALVIVADGTGYGSDGTIWGGEVLDAELSTFERVGGLDTFHLPGGEAAIEHPARILASLLEDPDRIDELLTSRTPLGRTEAETVRKTVESSVNAPETTSAGRFLDAISARLNICPRRRYEGEPAIRLEAVAAGAEPVAIELPFGRRDGQHVLDIHAVTQRVDELAETESPAVVAATAQDVLARGLAQIAINAAADRGVTAVGFSGGVAYNEAISRSIRAQVEAAGLEY